MNLEKDRIIVSLSPEDMMRLEMILTDRNKEEALKFVTEMYHKIKSKTVRGMRFHLDI